ncbi:DNA cytosine methyltransferase [Caulobacter sp. RL271]|uniref:DNA (cytosine-5-)-methyltransferase n=1 Tax=Caulobacter segnis TaxID=88688 RepID=A0ABY4ZZB0_9CAUL|nr:DNA cytosine methyltransferase [Caulobacter segnis]USQ97266.1 DNA cytosine methyltransferase [Caulobacter segnis]
MADGSAGPIVVPSNVLDDDDPFDVVYFAGCGGSSKAYEIALGIHPKLALNHKISALGVHMANFSETEHLLADVFDIDPRQIRPGKKWRSFWASPDCRHFSPAKGSAPVSASVRGLCWVVLKVAKLLGDKAPDVIFIENVPAFVTYGPLLPPDEHGRQYPDPKQLGRSFRTFVKRFQQCGYVVEWREDWVMAEFGVATTRKRLIMILRRDGKPIVWPKPTHAPRAKAKAKGLEPWAPMADHIDWSIKTPSIFLTQEEAKAQGLRVKRPLTEATMARIAKGVFRYVISASDPFIVPVTHQDEERGRSVYEPAPGFTSANRGEYALIDPEVVDLMAGCLVPRYGERDGQEPRCRSLDDPYPTAVPTGNGGQLVAAHLTKFRNGAVGVDMNDPMPAATANSYIKRPGGAAPLGVVSAYLDQMNTRDVGGPVEDPLRGMATRAHQGVVTAYVEQANTGMVGRCPTEPMSGMVTKGCTQRLVSANLQYAYGSNAEGAGDLRDPAWGISAGGNHHFLVQHELAMAYAPHGRELRAFLMKYYGPAVGQPLGDPMHCATTRARFGLVVVRGQLMQISDIGMRMLKPKEMAGAQGFPKDYVTGWNAITGRAATLTEEIANIGNSVSPEGAAPFIACNLGTAEQAARWL